MIRAGRRSEDGNQATLRERSQLGERAGERAGGMGEVDVDAKVLAEIDGLEAATHTLETGESAADVFGGYA